MSDTLNIFRWAPKELSQDAFICWMLSWADPQAAAVNPGMHQGGVAFLTALLALHGETAAAGAGVAVHRQIQHTDIVALVGDDLALLIEDKTNTKDGVEKLKRYVAAIQDEFPARRVLPVYFKTGDQSDYSAPRQAGYKTYLRPDLLRDLAAMAPACGHNAIFADFLAHMERREEAVRIYERSAVSDWGDFAWQGLFMALQDRIENMDWDLVKPPGAPFMAAYWHFGNWGVWDTYLQIQQDLLVMKMGCQDEMDGAARRDQRDQWLGILTKAAEGSQVRILRPGKRSIGKTMTAAHIGDRAEWIRKGPDGYLDLDATVEYLKQAMAVLDNARAMTGGQAYASTAATVPVSTAVEPPGPA